jgi:ribosome biogenesis GTPase / thiamine phosphate phosphatase
MTSDAAALLAARVIECFGRRVIVQTENGERLPAELFGKRLSVVCGDLVQLRPARSVHSQQDALRVVEVGPRKSLLARTDSRGRSEPLAANLNLLGVLIAPQPAPDPFVVDRYLAGASYAGIESAVIMNKCDLPAAQAPTFVALLEEYRQVGYPVLQLSARHGEAVAALTQLLKDRVTMLVGQSGVGKSTLTNALIPASARSTRSLSGATGEGRHTTVSTALFALPGGGELIDSPGVRDYAPALAEDARVQTGWPEILHLAPQCRFNNCLHLREPGCAVMRAIADGTLSARRHESYKRLLHLMRDLAPDYERRRT